MSVILAFCCDILLKYISRGLNEGLIGICHLRFDKVKLCEQMRNQSRTNGPINAHLTIAQV